MVGFWIGLRPRNLKKSSGGVLEVRLRRTFAFVFLHQAATVFDGLAWCFSLKSGLRPASRLRRGCFLFFWWGGWELFGIRRKKKVEKLVIREKNDYLCHVERLFVSFFLPLMGVNG